MAGLGGAAALLALALAPASAEGLRGTSGSDLPGVRTQASPALRPGSFELRSSKTTPRTTPYGDRIPPMRGALAHSALVAELRRGGSSDAVPSDAPDLGSTVRGALMNDDGLLASLARADAARFASQAALGAMLPKLNLEADYGTRDPTGEWREATYRTARAVLTIPVFASGANLATMRAARASRDAAALAHLAEERRAILEGATAHLDLHAAIRVEAALAENARGTTRTLTASRALFEAGEASLADVAVAEANLESARGELAAARQSLERARIDYRSRTGRAAPATPLPPETGALVPDDVEDAVAASLRGPTVASGFRKADAARHAARAELGAAGPRVDVTGSLGHDVDALAKPEGEWSASVGVRLTVPIVDFETIPGVRAARARARAAEYDARDGAREIERKVRTAHATHAGAVARQSAAERRAAAMRTALEATRREYAAGFRTVTDVVRAQVGLARARIDLATIERDRHRAAYTLAIAMGWLPESLRD